MRFRRHDNSMENQIICTRMKKKAYDKMQMTGSTGTNQKMDTRLDKI